jgi:hypothetical protein
MPDAARAVARLHQEAGYDFVAVTEVMEEAQGAVMKPR